MKTRNNNNNKFPFTCNLLVSMERYRIDSQDRSGSSTPSHWYRLRRILHHPNASIHKFWSPPGRRGCGEAGAFRSNFPTRGRPLRYFSSMAIRAFYRGSSLLTISVYVVVLFHDRHHKRHGCRFLVVSMKQYTFLINNPV